MKSTKTIKYAVRENDSDSVYILFESYFPMDEEEILNSVVYEGYPINEEYFTAEELKEDSKYNLSEAINLSYLND